MDHATHIKRRREQEASPSFVYELWNDRGDCLYIGMSLSVGSRLASHASQPWWPQVREVKAHWHPNRRAAREAEQWAINEHQPVYNWNHTEQAAGSRSGGGHGHVAFRKADTLPLVDRRTFHFTATTDLAVCGQRLGRNPAWQHLGSSARGLLQVAEQYADLACPACIEQASTRLAAKES